MKNFFGGIQFVLLCYGALGMFWASSIATLGALGENEENLYLMNTCYLFFTLIAIVLLWVFFKRLKVGLKSNAICSGLVLLFIFNAKAIIFYAFDIQPKLFFRFGLLDFASTLIFIPHYIIECFKSGQSGWELFKKYGAWFVLCDILFLAARDYVLYFHEENKSTAFIGIVYLVLLVLFFKLFSQVIDKGLFNPLNWGEYKWYKQLFIIIPAVFIGIPCFILFFLFF